MSIKKLYQNGINEDGQNTIMDGLSFVQAINNNANELGTNTKLDLETHNTPEFIAKALREQTEKQSEEQVIGYQTPGGPDDIPTFEDNGMAVNSPSFQCDGLAQIYNKKVSEESEPSEDYPEITNVIVSETPNLREGESNVESGTTVATLSTEGGTEPFTYSVSGADAESFVISEDKLNVGGNALTEKTYNITITSTDTHSKTKTVSVEIEVQAAYPEITGFNITPVEGLQEGEANVQADAVVASLSTEGGTSPFTYSFNEDESNGVDNNSFKIEGATLKVNTTPLTEKEYKVSLKTTDTHNKTKIQNTTISVAAAIQA